MTLTAIVATVVLLAARPESFAGRVVAVHDGDTITVLDGRRHQTRIRLEGVDAPELGQAFGRAARRRTSTLVYGRDVQVLPEEFDRYGRLVARVLLDRADISLLLAREGLAWQFRRYSADPALASAEDDARRARRGLWQDPAPIPPWEFRRRAR